jgi:hypothetical protein
MDGCTRQNPAYRPAKGRAPSRGLFLFLGLIPVAVAVAGAGAAEAELLDEWRPDVKRARQHAKKRAGDVRFAVVAASGKQYDFHGGRASPMASTIKVMLLRDGHMRHFRYSSTWGLSRASAADGASLMSRFEDIVPRRHEGYAKHLLASIVSSHAGASPELARAAGSCSSRLEGVASRLLRGAAPALTTRSLARGGEIRVC